METLRTKNEVLDAATIDRKLRRMALQIAEQNIEEGTLVIAGIAGNGEVVASCLIAELQKIAAFTISYTTVHLNKKDPLSVTLQPTPSLEGQVIILVDDVADTGRTMLYALKPFLDAHPKKIQTAVLVERSHKLFPIQTDYTGLSITTTLQEHIAVETEDGRVVGAWIF
jgi:pyrimidine operon attenuation protein/uracil phosphoribosyltransferase